MIIVNFNDTAISKIQIDNMISGLVNIYPEQLKVEKISDQSILFQNRLAREVKYKEINQDNNELIITGIYFTYKNNLIQLYIHSPLFDLDSPLYAKSSKSKDYFFNSFEIK
jgi:hypothetical protein